ncbi:hypothetical protein PVL29_016187 [Vitis rotundifolia]|uniref:Uncharacterized protein n=1 Tax=Vitis rotundifolia TaxID=103349 RepID=A0AA38ZFE0_VITRO|nr:hypothetical protein PVL29_016187 [Vitis rotundifolia]
MLKGRSCLFSRALPTIDIEKLQVEDANGKCLPDIDAQIFLLILYAHV